jgi:hypothetical protein
VVGRLVDEIVERIRPRRVVLFGSHARGTADAGSDIDLLVVLDTDQPVMREARAIYRTLDHPGRCPGPHSGAARRAQSTGPHSPHHSRRGPDDL